MSAKFSVLIICSLIICTSGFCQELVFPVDGVLGDSFYPRDAEGNCSDVGNLPLLPAPRDRYTVVWNGKYGNVNQCYE